MRLDFLMPSEGAFYDRIMRQHHQPHRTFQHYHTHHHHRHNQRRRRHLRHLSSATVIVVILIITPNTIITVNITVCLPPLPIAVIVVVSVALLAQALCNFALRNLWVTAFSQYVWKTKTLGLSISAGLLPPKSGARILIHNGQ